MKKHSFAVALNLFIILAIFCTPNITSAMERFAKTLRDTKVVITVERSSEKNITVYGLRIQSTVDSATFIKECLLTIPGIVEVSVQGYDITVTKGTAFSWRETDKLVTILLSSMYEKEAIVVYVATKDFESALKKAVEKGDKK